MKRAAQKTPRRPVNLKKKNKLRRKNKMKTITMNTIRQYFLMLTLMCVGVMTAQAATYTVNQLAMRAMAFAMRPALYAMRSIMPTTPPITT